MFTMEDFEKYLRDELWGRIRVFWEGRKLFFCVEVVDESPALQMIHEI